MTTREVDAVERPIPLSPRGPRPAGVIYVRGDTGLNGALKRLKKDWAENVAASVRRHEHYTPPGERRRIKEKRARKRAAKSARQGEQFRLARLARTGERD